MLVFLEEVRPCRTKPGRLRRKGKCRCDCGSVKEYQIDNLRGGNSLSCGCTKMAKMQAASTKHGYTRGGSSCISAEYRAWSHLRHRCSGDTKNRKHYMDRGITVCKRWDDFTAFLADMGPRPSPKHSVDRIDVNGNYCPENCRWATTKEQSRNKRISKYLTAFGETKLMVEWAEELGIRYKTLYYRIQRGVPPEVALTPNKLVGKGRAATKPKNKDNHEAK